MSERETNGKLAGWQSKALIVGGIGAAAGVAGFLSDPDQFYRSYLTAYLYWLALSLGSLGWLMIYHLTTGRWGVPSRRIWEAAARVMPLMVVLVLPLLMGMESLFPWARPEAASDALIQGKAPYLNKPFFVGRALFYLGVWTVLAMLLSRWSGRQDVDGAEPWATKMRKLSGAGLVVMALTLTFFSVDWVMSLDPHWFSTIFGFLFAASDLLAAMAFTIVIVYALASSESLRGTVSIGVYHDLGNLTMAFVMLWAYMQFSQFLIIWSGNTQEEAPWYMARTGEGWIVISILLIIFHFALPLLILLTRRTKRAPNLLVKIALFMLFMRFVDLYWLVQPSFSHGGGLHPHWLDLALWAGIGGLWVGVFAMQLKGSPLLAKNDPRLAEVLESAGGHH